MSEQDRFEYDVLVVGGAGHVGFPLAVAFASRGLRTCIYDLNVNALEAIAGGTAPFLEPGLQPLLAQALESGTLIVSADAASISAAEHLVVVVGTPVDEHLSPHPEAVPLAVRELKQHLRPGQLLVLRSTVYPGVTRRIEQLLNGDAELVDIAFCPERIAEGKAMSELFELPQIVSGRTEVAVQRATSLFGKLTPSIVVLSPEEAELAKLFTNAWRYIKFAAANQFFMMANDQGLDFERIRSALSYDYPRAADMPGPGFAAGPCLFKDTMQLAAVSGNTFTLGQSAMLVNEGLPGYLVSRLEKTYDLGSMTVGILGMAFKGESDDTRSSLAYKLKRLLSFRTLEVLTTDPFVTTDDTLVPMEDVLARADLLLIAAPHGQYRSLGECGVPIVDVWNIIGEGVRV
ncbi:nucleotide sugar dehydrogenase [Nocardioides mesophilus]|uniref:Nucleotide sugar dehydrogenase n=1 Tax=Nocardioides mesophilus TaxID=433659 RepID=A0A7G9RC04_9ACTN|nr:nucleotide sugar dehydrogenase [Nocardioides mesophilus]QNN53129.1 nucleotide sugar dehydrogenase [Nocardioides mesophilus]